jgi:hypothetical protein
VRQLARADDHEPEAVLRDLRLAPPVVEPTLLAATDPANGLAAVEERHCLVVLTLPVFDH